MSYNEYEHSPVVMGLLDAMERKDALLMQAFSAVEDLKVTIHQFHCGYKSWGGTEAQAIEQANKLLRAITKELTP